jgi:hypothetical protein
MIHGRYRWRVTVGIAGGRPLQLASYGRYRWQDPKKAVGLSGGQLFSTGPSAKTR